MGPGPAAAPPIPQQNGMVGRVIRTLKKQCIHRHCFGSIRHAARVIGDWIGFCNNRSALPGACHAHACRGLQISSIN
ncbi:integrase core domain-containing protein [Falsigemmobacter faecalis]|uniref:Integrase catalytic domain-containing protein n=2 Tax=Falsigemmobacter faecalis TaxID=2488730 RepID=A0A3P3CXV1_9RHOB|nr:hypothetical protein EG244_20230 [Falsigemmobacter faecalis]